MSEKKKYNLVENLLLNTSFELSAELEHHLNILKRRKVEKPTLFVGSGTCGQISGAKKILEGIQNYLTENKLEADVVEVGCIGMCWAEPLLDIQLPGRSRISYQKVSPDKITPILDATFNATFDQRYTLGQFKNEFTEQWADLEFIENLPFFKYQTRNLLKNCGLINPCSLDEYIAQGGYKALSEILLSNTPAQVRDIILQSKLRGRGGGGYLTGQKWENAAQTQGDQKYLICNADESDPGAFMDRALIEGNPHLLLEGITMAAYAIGTSKCYVYIRSSYELAIRRLQKAIDDCKEAGLLGHDILGSGFHITIHLKTGAGAFVCGEETALINSIEGKRGIPRPKPPYPSQQGLFNKPTVVNNVETLANVPEIIAQGAKWFQETGTMDSPGTKVFSITGKINKTGMIEVPMGTTMRKIIFDIAGGIKQNKTFKAAQLGGPSGSCIVEDYLDIPIAYESLSKLDSIMGSGGLVVVDEDTCMVDLAKFFIDVLQDASCGKCIPCREGTHRIREILEDITKKPSEENHHTLDRFKGVMQLEELGKVISETSLCGLGQSAPRPVLSALKYFREEFEEHIYERKCRANICRELRSYYIDVDTCTGCTICINKCPEKAIIGSATHPHFIIEDRCNGCGICLEVCKFDAVRIK